MDGSSSDEERFIVSLKITKIIGALSLICGSNRLPLEGLCTTAY